MKENKDELNPEEMNRAAGGGSGFGEIPNPAYCNHPTKHYIGGSKKENGKTLYQYECNRCRSTIWREEEPEPGGAGGSW